MNCKFCKTELTTDAIWYKNGTQDIILSDMHCQTCSFFCYTLKDNSYHRYGFHYQDWILTFDTKRPLFRIISKDGKIVVQTTSIPNINPSNVARRLPIFILFS